MVNHWWSDEERRTLCGDADEHCCSRDMVSCNECYDALPPAIQAQQYWWVRA
jgi:hypothetical protein